MPLPYQCITACNTIGGDKNAWLLFGASGAKLVAQSSTGTSSIWPAGEVDVTTDDSGAGKAEGSPGKRIKLSLSTEQHAPNFSCLALSNSKQHLVAVTAEDKCIHVFKFDLNCNLNQLSQRCMARRPCAIIITSDDSTILCADKFGDVYALPLIPPPEDEQKAIQTSEQAEATNTKQFLPAASVLTVHSGRNRKVLEEQMKQASKATAKSKDALKFKHELLLGHVSMLTDIAYTTVNGRSYIITADRDEHIRVSRGVSQAHIIEGFCQGHEAFVSRLCLANAKMLVSGGGDDYIFVWDWLKYRLLERVCIRDTVLGFLRAHQHLASRLPANEEDLKIAVSGIWSGPFREADGTDIVVGCEGVPALFSFNIGGSSAPGYAIPLAGNVLDVTFVNPGQSQCTAIVSVDNLHKPGSTTEIREDEGRIRLQHFSYGQGSGWMETTALGEVLEWFNCRAPGSKNGGELDSSAQSVDEAEGWSDKKAIRDMLYSVEHLRKRPGSED